MKPCMRRFGHRLATSGVARRIKRLSTDCPQPDAARADVGNHPNDDKSAMTLWALPAWDGVQPAGYAGPRPWSAGPG